MSDMEQIRGRGSPPHNPYNNHDSRPANSAGGSSKDDYYNIHINKNHNIFEDP